MKINTLKEAINYSKEYCSLRLYTNNILKENLFTINKVDNFYDGISEDLKTIYIQRIMEDSFNVIWDTDDLQFYCDSILKSTFGI